MGMDFFGVHLPKKYYLISGQLFGPVIDSLCSALLLQHDPLLTSVDLLLLLISLSCGIYCNCVKHNYSASDLEGNVITEQPDSYDIECYMCLYICTFPW